MKIQIGGALGEICTPSGRPTSIAFILLQQCRVLSAAEIATTLGGRYIVQNV